MKIWTNTSTLSGFDRGLVFTESKEEAEIALIGSKPLEISQFPNLKAIFRAGIGKDNVPVVQARKKNIVVRFPSEKTVDVIFEETSNFTCSLIFRMLYSNVGDLDSWRKTPRFQLKDKKLLIIGCGNIGSRVAEKMGNFLQVHTYDILSDENTSLEDLISSADCITLHIPYNSTNHEFFDSEKLSLMKDDSSLVNTARGKIVDQDALFQEIKAKRIKAAFDVFWEEPYIGSLRKYHPDPFFMTPHIASTCLDFLKGCRDDLDKLVEELQCIK